MSCGDSAKGPRVYDWTCARLRAVPGFGDAEAGRGRWLLARRSLADPTEIAYYLAAGPADTELAELVRVPGDRWAI
ncbi:MAG TPA: hypothetical protein VLH10_25430 [Yinghuangia sp.]|nr:hypothetical protein [Yinghuangia sp.]